MYRQTLTTWRWLSIAVIIIATQWVDSSVITGDLETDPPSYSHYINGTCSMNVLQCDADADCVQLTNNRTYCKCLNNNTLDGYKNGEGCTKDTVFSCSGDADCHKYATCNQSRCVCKEGFTGNGNACEDINECDNPDACPKYSTCKDILGNFTCTCFPRYHLIDNLCIFKCNVDQDCNAVAGICVNQKCECDKGYEGDGKENCTDVDECVLKSDDCSTNADCINTEGTFKCKCRNGFSGNGKKCVALPTNCHDIFLNKPGAKSGTYTIDTDGPLEQNTIEVYCDIRPDMGITVIEQTGHALQSSSTSGGNKVITYTPPPAALKPLIEASAFCSQKFWLKCKSKWSLQNYVSWDDNEGNTHKSWGTTKPDMCPCGVLGMCENRLSPCNCDGNNDEREVDSGTIIDKTLLPVSAVYFKSSDNTAQWQINALRCAPKPIDILKNCQEIKDKLKIKYSGTHLIDVDGPDGPLEPVLVYCDMTTSPNVGITVIPPSSDPNVIFNESGTKPVTYNVPKPVIDALIKGSIFCDQSFEYTCEGGKQDVKVSAGPTAKELNYLPGGIKEVPGSCGCGVTASCTDNSSPCNCQIDDGKTHTDIGFQIDLDDLPIVSINVDFMGLKKGVSVVGPLRCSTKQFGIEANCEKYRAQGETRSYTMLIDPDGPQVGNEANVAPFRVQCIMQEKPPMGITIVNHDSRGKIEFNGVNYKEGINYRYANPDQLKALKKRCTYVQQDIKLFCKDFPKNAGSSQNTYAYFTPVDRSQLTFLSGNSTHLQCTATTGEDECPCLPKQASESNADGKTYFPVNDIDLTPAAMFLGKLDVTIGAFKCFDVSPTCNAIHQAAKGREGQGESLPIDGDFTIDPDGSGGVDAFVVKCNFPMTRTPAGPRTGKWTYTDTEPMTKCFEVNYSDGYGNILGHDQVMAMVRASNGHCTQSLYLSCNNAPITGMITYETCDGIVQKGWAGSGGKSSCACGVTGTCVGGPQSKCNCDTENGNTMEDGGIIVNNKYLPVCKVCIKFSGIVPGGDNPIPSRSASFRVTDLTCSNYKTGISGSCMSARIGSAVRQSGTIYVQTPNGPAPVFCDLRAYPPMGVFQMFPKEPTFTVPPNGDTIYDFEYNVYDITIVSPLVNKFEYCTQDVSVTCANSDLSFTAEYGWYGHTLKRQTFISKTPNNETPQCKGHCDCDNGSPAGGISIDMMSPPITKIKLGASAGQRSVTVGPLECFDIHKDCYEIMLSGQLKTVFWQNKTYTIDPDGPGGYDPILAVCTFDKKNNNAVTEAVIEGQGTYTVTGTSSTPFNIPLTYRGASPEQLKELAKNSKFCKQGIQYNCVESPIQPLGKINPDAGELNGFGLADDITTLGCACGKLGTCGTSTTCRCDANGTMGSYDRGVVTAKAQLPITSLTLGGQTSADAVGKATVTSLECSRIPKDLPKNCQEAFEQEMTEGEILINPTNDIPPFLVYCDMSLVPGKGIARVKPGFGGGPVTSGDSTDVPYKGLTDTQLRALIDSSDYCYQPVLVDCYKTGFIKDGSFSWVGADGKQHSYWGNGNPARKTCSCGEEGFCGGDGGKNTMELRKCNCEIGDDVWRKDGGIMRVKKDLPVREFTYSGAAKPGAMANMTIGDLYCGMEEIHLDVCAMNYDDCHDWAKCSSKEVSDFVCVCKKGYQGLVKGTSINDLWANGRQCYDDDECSYGMCHWGAECNNTVGDFDCNCRSGWRQDVNNKRICHDINECEEKTYVCDPNARCENIYESYDCRCNRGYVGNGKTCEPLGLCTCFGDPHCLSFDEKWLHYQGLCEYTMARDNCTGTPNFQVVIHNWDRTLPVHDAAWVKGVLIKFKDTNIDLRLGREIRVNGVLMSSYFGNDFMVIDDGSSVVFRTNTNLKVVWNGRGGVNIFANKDYQNKLCGLCGNYNEKTADDWMLGPRCGHPGTLTENNNKFGTSWSANKCQPECDKPETPKDPKCNMKKEIAEARCGRILNTATSVFKDCLPKLSPNVMSGLRVSCIYDMCAVTTGGKDSLCEIAAQVAQECRSIGESIPVWMNSMGLNCGSTCGKNMKYHLCGGMAGKKPGPVMSCLARLSGKPAYPSAYCLDGCFCEEGYYRDGDKCLPEDDCGCVHSNGTGQIYMKPKEKIVMPGCGHFIECADNHLTESQNLNCDGNATCSLDEKTGIYGCHCNKGFMGSGVECSEDPCADVDCNGENMECVNGKCLCKMGFTADCNTCIDINECASEDKKCTKIGEMCVNTNGSYYCGCQEGFYEGPEGKCVDFDECKAGIDNCPDNSECKNTKGGYECVCCAGYSMQGDSCINDGSGLNAGILPKCCSCFGSRCKAKGEVCGSDGKTYSSWKELIIKACKAGKSVGKSYNGKCRSMCGAGVTCERPSEECKVVNNVAQCGCPKCEEGESNSTEDSVCTSNHIVFKSMCEFRKYSCFVGTSEIKVLSTGKNCTGRGVEGSFFTQWTPWSPCSVSCGFGHIHRTRTPIKYITDDNGFRIKETAVAACYRTCPEGPCTDTRCRDYEVCTENGDNVNCKCPDCTNMGIDYVCGRVGNIVHTYINDCELKKDACLKKLKPTVVQDFSCESYPEKCSKMANWGSRDIDECTSLYMDWGKCGGGCGVWAATCCTEQHESKSVEFYCGGVKTMKMTPVVTSCKCINETITP